MALGSDGSTYQHLATHLFVYENGRLLLEFSYNFGYSNEKQIYPQVIVIILSDTKGNKDTHFRKILIRL